MVDLVEARFDVPLQHPLIGVGGVEEDLLDGVLSPAPGAEAVGTRLEIRLKDRLQHQLEGSLHGPVTRGRDAKPAKLPRLLADQLLPHGQRNELPGLQILTKPGQERVRAEDDGARFHPIHPGRPCPSVSPHPVPRHHQERGIGDKVEQVIEPTSRIVDRPLVQLGLDPQYPPLGLIEVGPRRASIHQRPPDLPVPASRTRWVPSPCGRFSQPRTTTDPPPHTRVISRRRALPRPAWTASRKATQARFPRSPLTGRRDRCPAFPLQACPRLRRSPSSWPPTPTTDVEAARPGCRDKRRTAIPAQIHQVSSRSTS